MRANVSDRARNRRRGFPRRELFFRGLSARRFNSLSLSLSLSLCKIRRTEENRSNRFTLITCQPLSVDLSRGLVSEQIVGSLKRTSHAPSLCVRVLCCLPLFTVNCCCVFIAVLSVVPS